MNIVAVQHMFEADCVCACSNAAVDACLSEVWQICIVCLAVRPAQSMCNANKVLVSANLKWAARSRLP